ncbi:hypothetical protein BCR43DRAFT_454859 [Syncephalastrum racemosum]|uniref:DUF221-domain-containing protein n=1 Tax=Syncephalastrum racemosum TaxID=13706 RepID=A0A1X2HHU1_SYNRA|nr:hypothetical protein BCR43DRAFT_454859 [Syncephalastrum racemosum]
MATIDTVYYIPSLVGLTTTFGIAAGVSVVCLVGFEVCRSRLSMQYLYAPRTQLANTNTVSLPQWPLAWLIKTLNLTEEDYLRQAGVDAALYIRFLRMAVHFLTFACLTVCPALLALHWTTNDNETQQEDEDYYASHQTLDRLANNSTTTRTPLAAPAHAVFAYLISFGWLWLLFVNHWHHRDLLLRASKPISTVLLTHIPRHLRTQDAIARAFDVPLERVYFVPHVSLSLLARRHRLLDSFEQQLMKKKNDAWDVNENDSRKRQALDTLVSLNQRCLAPQEPTGNAFVTFGNAEAAQQACGSKHRIRGVFVGQPAPEPRSILWRGLVRRGRRERLMGRLRGWLVFMAVWSITIFWLFPVSFILGLTSIESLSQHFQFLTYFLDTSHFVRSFTQNVMPMLLVTFFMSLLPWLLLIISKQQDFVSRYKLEDAVLCRYYRFAIFNVLIVFLLGTTFLSTLLDVLYEPTKLIHVLAAFLPQGANFFLSYILFNTCTHAMELLQLGSQFFGHFIFTSRWWARTPRRWRRATRPYPFPYYYYYPNHMLVLVIALTYSLIQPLVLMFALLYFSVALACFKHQFMYCYVRQYESQGRHYRRMASYTSDGLLIFQLTMVGLLYLKGALIAATAILPLLFFTVWAKIRLARSLRDLCATACTLNVSIPATQSAQKSNKWWFSLDDIWKFSYIQSWCTVGRYGGVHAHARESIHASGSPELVTSSNSSAALLQGEEEQQVYLEKQAEESDRLDDDIAPIVSDAPDYNPRLYSFPRPSQRKLNTIRAEADDANARADELSAHVKQLESEHISKDHELLSIEIRVKNLEKQLSTVEQKLKDTSTKFSETNAKADGAEKKKEELEKRLEEQEKRQEELSEAFSKARAELDEMARQFDDL